MPELPEVETVVRTLEKQIKDEEIIDIQILYEPIVTNAKSFKEKMLHQHFRAFLRRGKYLIFKMDDIYFVSHLRMEGKYYIQNIDEPVSKHMHVIFTLSNGKQLRYNDTRKFGRMEIMPLDTDLDHFHDLGLEPFDERLTTDYLKDILKKSNHPIKQDLLDQHIIAGIGNIYADEICYYARLHPSTLSKYLNDKNISDIIEGTRIILSKAIKAGGTTIRSYTSSLGVTGRFQLECKVHQREGLNCYNCNEKIKKIKVATRGTYYCPNCQKEKKILIGICGSIASGKSEVSKMIQDRYPVFNCDIEAKKCYNKDHILYNEIIALLGEDILTDGKADYHKISNKIFNNDQLLQQLEAIIHPYILQKILQLDNKINFVECSILFEKQWQKYFDETIYITCDSDIAIKRCITYRHMTKEDVLARISKQYDAAKAKQYATYVVENNGSISQLKNNIEDIIKEIETKYGIKR